MFASAGSDAKLFLYDGTTGDAQGELSGHTGTVYAVAWDRGSSDNQLASFSADASVKLWDAETRECVRTWTLASSGSPQDHQVGGAAVDGGFVSLAGNGDLTVFDARAPEPVRKQYGAQKGILAAAAPKGSSTLFAGDNAGRVLRYDGDSKCAPVQGGSQSYAVAMSAADGRVFVASMDDSVKSLDTGAGSFTWEPLIVPSMRR